MGGTVSDIVEELIKRYTKHKHLQNRIHVAHIAGIDQTSRLQQSELANLIDRNRIHVGEDF